MAQCSAGGIPPEADTRFNEPSAPRGPDEQPLCDSLATGLELVCVLVG